MIKPSADLHIDGIDLETQHDRYREIALTLRDNPMVQDCVQGLAIHLHGSPNLEKDAAFMLADIKSRLRSKGEYEGIFFTDFHLREMAGAFMSDALEMLANGGRA